MSQSASRTQPDACPGALRVHEAADGGLARVRVPGGALMPRQVRALAAVASLGDGGLELTSRANLQVRGLPPDAGRQLAERLAAAGLLPSVAHERVRNIIASPYDDGRAQLDARALAAELDAALCADPRLADLPGRFLFAVDDGRADVVPLNPDVGLFALGDRVALVLAGEDSGVRLAPGGAVPGAIAAAEAFLAERTSQWRIAELADGPRRVADRVAAALGVDRVDPVPVPATPPGTHAQVGVVFRRDGRTAVAAGAPLGRLSPEQVDIITAASDAAGGARLTPWRTVVLPGLPDEAAGRWVSDLAAHGLLVDPSADGVGVTSCTGRPGCAKALADVREDATRTMSRAVGLPVHWAGCRRRCGRPQGRVVEVLATEAGYEVGLGETTTSAADVDQVAAALDAARRAV